MSALTRHLARGLDLHAGTRVVCIEREGRRWALRSADPLGHFDAVLVTTPPEQAVALLHAAPDLQRAAAARVSEPCWAVMLVFEQPLPVAFDAAFVRHGPLAWIARDASKPGRGAHEAWVLHAGPAWSREHLEEAPARVETLLSEALAQVVRCDLPAVRHGDAHRWALSTVTSALEVGVLWDAALRVGVGGDWCAGSRVEGALRSGLEAGARMAADLGAGT